MNYSLQKDISKRFTTGNEATKDVNYFNLS